jgi:hypothetical protein
MHIFYFCKIFRNVCQNFALGTIHIELFIEHLKLNLILSSKMDIHFALRILCKIFQYFIKILQNISKIKNFGKIPYQPYPGLQQRSHEVPPRSVNGTRGLTITTHV